MNWRLLSHYLIAFLFGAFILTGVASKRPDWFDYKQQQQRKIQMAKSKVIQIAAHGGVEGEPDVLYALTEDGSVWLGEWTKNRFSWTQKLPDPNEEKE